MKRILAILTLILICILCGFIEVIVPFCFIILILVLSLFLDSLPQLFLRVLQGKVPLRVFTCNHNFIQFENFMVESHIVYSKLIICKKCGYITTSFELKTPIDIIEGDKRIIDGRLFIRDSVADEAKYLW